jgi:methanogenic corrinoid protein MtbC1
MAIPTGSSSECPVRTVYDVYLKALLDADRPACLDIVQQLVQGNVPVKKIYLELFERSLIQVGELWESDRISVAVEHLATAITESAMCLLYPIIFATPRCGRRAVVSCVADEFNQIGAKIVADIFELHGWDGYFLGANVPATALLDLLHDKKPDFLCLSLTVHTNLPFLLETVETVRSSLPHQPILVGGQAFRRLDAAEHCPTATYVESIHRLEEIIGEPR